MSQVEEQDMSLRDLPSFDGQDVSSTIADVAGLDVSNSNARQVDSHNKRVSVLVGAAVLQLPIWGFPMSYGVFQEYFSETWTLSGSRSTTGVVGTTQNGVLYLSMPFLFGLFTKRYARHRKTAALAGSVLTCISFLLSSYSTAVWHLVATQGVLAALGCALIYSPTTLTLGEWYSTHNLAFAYGLVFSSKNIVGSVLPIIFRVLLSHTGLRHTLRYWTVILALTSVPAILLIPSNPSAARQLNNHEQARVPWSFLKHKTFYIFTTATMLQSAGYGIPQTYLNTYAHDIAHLSQTSATLLLTLFNLPGILSSSFFGYLSDKRRCSLSASTITFVSGISTALATFFLWGFTSRDSLALLILYSISFGFFAGGYSATWSGSITELEEEGARHNEAVDPGLLYGLFNGARGVGYVSGGLASVPLLGVGDGLKGALGYGSGYGPLILFTGLCSVGGGLGVLWNGRGWDSLRMLRCW